MTGDTIDGDVVDVQNKGRFKFNSKAYRDVVKTASSGARDPHLIAAATTTLNSTDVLDTSPIATATQACMIHSAIPIIIHILQLASLRLPSLQAHHTHPPASG